ncbi:MAG: DUF3520 domain-containing protein, partial [Planctomycetes bacterium]|nr:DUF3520 domain-containing protein [Planctomycetota bacterium]
EIPVIDRGGTLAEASDDFRFASAVAAYGMILRNSEYRGAADYEMVCALAGSATGSAGIRREALQYREDFIHYTMTANVELALANARALLKLKLSDLELAMIFRNGGLSPEKLNLVLTRALGIEGLSEVAGQLQARLDNGLEILSRVEVRPKSNYRSEFIDLVLKAAAISQPRIRPIPMPGPEN